MAALEVDSVSKSYGRRRAVRDMTFDIRGGDLFGFVGGNGAGKTTTMRIVLGVLTPDAGEVRWNGRPADFAVRRSFGYMPEERGLYPRMKVSAQLRYLGELHGLSSRAARHEAERWIDRLVLGDHAGDEVQNLSLGNQQRVQLAAALVHRPRALVLDEPFSGLDPLAVDVMGQVLAEAAADGVPVLFSSHQLALVERICHRVGIVSQGRLVACGTIDELSASADRHLLVDAPGASGDWTDGLPDVRVLAREGTRWRLGLAAHVDAQRVLRAALATGPVLAFTPERPSLARLYREVAGRDGGGGAAAPPPPTADGTAVGAGAGHRPDAEASAAPRGTAPAPSPTVKEAQE
ncbi:ABC transporter ATP-binding protein [Streptomyces sp. JNUCC 64]